MHIAAFFIDQQLRQWHFVMCFPMFNEALLQVKLLVSCHFRCSFLKANKVSRSEETRKVEYECNFWKCAAAVYPKLSKSVHAWQNFSLSNLTFFETQCNSDGTGSCSSCNSSNTVVVVVVVVVNSDSRVTCLCCLLSGSELSTRSTNHTTSHQPWPAFYMTWPHSLTSMI